MSLPLRASALDNNDNARGDGWQARGDVAEGSSFRQDHRPGTHEPPDQAAPRRRRPVLLFMGFVLSLFVIDVEYS